MCLFFCFFFEVFCFNNCLHILFLVETTRCMMFDDSNKKILNYNFIKTLLEFEDELKRAFALYYSENLLYNKLLLDWSELSLHNKKMSSFGLIKFLKEAEILPHLLSIEHFEDLMIKILVQFIFTPLSILLCFIFSLFSLQFPQRSTNSIHLLPLSFSPLP